MGAMRPPQVCSCSARELQLGPMDNSECYRGSARRFGLLKSNPGPIAAVLVALSVPLSCQISLQCSQTGRRLVGVVELERARTDWRFA